VPTPPSGLDESTLNHSPVLLNSNQDSIKINTPIKDDVKEHRYCQHRLRQGTCLI